RVGMICEFATATLSTHPTRREIRAPCEHLFLQRYAAVHRGTRPRAHRPHARPARRRRAALGKPRPALRRPAVRPWRSLGRRARARPLLARREMEPLPRLRLRPAPGTPLRRGPEPPQRRGPALVVRPLGGGRLQGPPRLRAETARAVPPPQPRAGRNGGAGA